MGSDEMNSELKSGYSNRNLEKAAMFDARFNGAVIEPNHHENPKGTQVSKSLTLIAVNLTFNHSTHTRRSSEKVPTSQKH